MDSICGALYVIATPIGNLDDITFRAIEVLKSVDYILSEDTRETQKILQKYNITGKSQLIYTDQKHTAVCKSIIDLLKDGKNIALVSDSGTPVISDPGYKLIVEVIKNGINIISVPGPSAVISALAVSGLPTDKFIFMGFLPKQKSKVSELLSIYGKMDATLVIYESPYRVEKLLNEVFVTLGNRQVCLVNDQTKMFEKIIRGTVEKVLKSKIVNKGEYVVLIAKEGFYL